MWLEEMTVEHDQAGGIWVAGDKPFSAEDGYPGRNGGQLCVKLWFADHARYGPGKYQPKNRQDEQKWEYVKVWHGQLGLEAKDIGTFLLSPPGEGVDIPPEVVRSWYLPADHAEAWGITICRPLTQRPLQAGQGVGYELHQWDAGEGFVYLPRQPRLLANWRLQLIIPVEGAFHLLRHRQRQQLVDESSFCFLTRDQRPEWVVGPHSVGQEHAKALSIFLE